MTYKTLYEENEQNNALHVGTVEVENAEHEVSAFLALLDKDLREQADTLFGKLARAYEIQGFLFGGNVSGTKWNAKTQPVVGQSIDSLNYRGATTSPVYQIDRKTRQIVAEFGSVREASRKTGLCDSSISKACKGKLVTCGGYLWQYAIS